MVINNILAVVAHPDDLEIMAGGSLIKWLNEGKKVHVLTLSNGISINHHNEPYRLLDDVQNEFANVNISMKYSTSELLDEPTMQIQFSDRLVCEILARIEQYNIDTIVTTWNKDTNHDHEIVSKLVISSSRRVHNVLQGHINYFKDEIFSPNVFVDISDTWEQKIEVIKLYDGVWSKSGKDMYEFLDTTSRYYGKMIGVERAEGFFTNKLKIG